MKENLSAEDYKRELAELARFPDMNPGPVLRMNFEGEVLLSNAAAQKLFGLDLHGKNWTEICPGITAKVWKNIIKTNEIYSVEVLVNELTFVFHHRMDHKSKLVFAFGTDITERKLYENELRKQKSIIEEYARFPHMNPGPVLRLDYKGKILLSNIAAENLFGKDLLGKNWNEICKDVTNNIWHDVLTSEVVIPVEAIITNKIYTFNHRCDVESKLVFVFGTDITLQRHAEKQLRQSEKMATLGTLAAGVAHEINNPAAAANRASQQLQELVSKLQIISRKLSEINLSDNEKDFLTELTELINKKDLKQVLSSKKLFSQEAELEDWLETFGFDNAWEITPSLVHIGIDKNYLYAKTKGIKYENTVIIINWFAAFCLVNELIYEINDCSSRISEIVLALKNYSFLDQAPVQNVNIHDGIENTIIMLRHKLQNGITINRKYYDNLPKITAFGSELNQVWTNILDNAIEAMNGKGTITISTSIKDNYLDVEIEDDGPGIPDDIQSRIFDPFFTTKEPGKGTGLGLSTSYGIISEKHNGILNVYSRPGSTKILVRLPIN